MSRVYSGPTDAAKIDNPLLIIPPRRRANNAL